MKLDYVQALKRIHEARGAWIMHGQEPLLEQNLLDAFRKSWQQQEVERQRHAALDHLLKLDDQILIGAFRLGFGGFEAVSAHGGQRVERQRHQLQAEVDHQEVVGRQHHAEIGRAHV